MIWAGGFALPDTLRHQQRVAHGVARHRSSNVVHPTSTYDVIELIGTSSTSWEEAAENVIKIEAYRTKLKPSFKYEPKTSKPGRK